MNGQTEGWTEPDGQTDMIVEIVSQIDSIKMTLKDFLTQQKVIISTKFNRFLTNDQFLGG